MSHSPSRARGLFFALAVGVLITAAPAPACATESSSYAKAMAAYEDRHLDDALRYAREAVREQPDHVDAYVVLGELYYLRQELDQAASSWGRALKLAPSRQDIHKRMERLQKELTVERDLARRDTYPFVVRFAAEQTPVKMNDLALILQDTYRLVGQHFDYFPQYTITVIMYPEADFEKVKGISHQVAGLFDGKIRLPLRSDLQTSDDVRRILWHEYTHALVHDLSKGRCPMWLNEGLAVAQETRVIPRDLGPLRQALAEGGVIPWTQLWQEKEYQEASITVRYLQSYTIVQYLVRLRGWPQMVSLLRRLGRGMPIQDALKAEYRTDPTQLEQEWLAWLERELR